ncbi:MAG: hypothetical protein HYX75_16130 [Acidobacteria bacterium]|nr:hypothetical protein [Acidobacteriota bacterium]
MPLRFALLLSIVACLASDLLGAQVSASASFRDSEALVRSRPDDLDSYDCFYLTAKRTKAWTTARLHLESLLRQEPSDHRARRALVRLADAHGDEDAEQLYRDAVDGLAAQNDATAEVVSRTELSTLLWERGRFEEARGFFGSFYERLREGADVSEAAAWARRDFVDRHAPAAAWGWCHRHRQRDLRRGMTGVGPFGLAPPHVPSKPFKPPSSMMVNPRSDGGFDVLDPTGKPLPNPPIIEFGVDPDTPDNPAYHGPWGNQVPTLYPPAGPATAYWSP